MKHSLLCLKHGGTYSNHKAASFGDSNYDTNSMQHNPSEHAISCSVSPNYPHFVKT